MIQFSVTYLCQSKLKIHHKIFVIIFFQDKISFCNSPDSPGFPFGDQASFEFKEIHMSLPLNPGIKGVNFNLAG